MRIRNETANNKHLFFIYWLGNSWRRIIKKEDVQGAVIKWEAKSIRGDHQFHVGEIKLLFLGGDCY